MRGTARASGSCSTISIIGLCFRAKGRLVEAAVAVAMCLRIFCSWSRKKTSARCARKMDLAFSDLVERGSERGRGKRPDDARAVGSSY